MGNGTTTKPWALDEQVSGMKFGNGTTTNSVGTNQNKCALKDLSCDVCTESFIMGSLLQYSLTQGYCKCGP